MLVDVAAVDGLAGDLGHDVVVVADEKDLGAFDKAIEAVFPGFGLGVVVHGGCAENEAAGIVRELIRAIGGAVATDGGAVNDVVCFVVDESSPPHPVPSPFGPVGVGLISGVKGESSAESEEAGLRN